MSWVRIVCLKDKLILQKGVDAIPVRRPTPENGLEIIKTRPVLYTVTSITTLTADQAPHVSTLPSSFTTAIVATYGRQLAIMTEVTFHKTPYFLHCGPFLGYIAWHTHGPLHRIPYSPPAEGSWPESPRDWTCRMCKSDMASDLHSHRLCCQMGDKHCDGCLGKIIQSFVEARDDPATVRSVQRIMAKFHLASEQMNWLYDQGVGLANANLYCAQWWEAAEQSRVDSQTKLYQGMNRLVGLARMSCCKEGEFPIHRIQSCLPPELSKRYMLRWMWLHTPVEHRRCCAYSDCGEFLPLWCKYPVLEPTELDSDVPPRVHMYGPQAPRRWYCPVCRRDSEEPLRDPPRVLDTAQTEFLWLKVGYPMLVPAGYPPDAMLGVPSLRFRDFVDNAPIPDWRAMPLLEE